MYLCIYYNLINYINNMKKIYTVYQLNEKVNESGNPYIGFTENLIRRSKQWKRNLELDYIPELIPLYFSTEEDKAFDWEQNKKVETGWRREPALDELKKRQLNGRKKAKQLGVGIHTIESKIKGGKISGKLGLGGKSNAINGTGFCNFKSRSKGGLIGGSKGGKTTSLIERTCPYCNKTIKGLNYNRYHGERCKFK